MARNTCSCPNPPGGVARCDVDQLAICRVRDGVPEMECLSAPALARMPDRNRFQALANWAIAAIAGVSRSPGEEIDHRAMAMLRESVQAHSGQGTAEDVDGLPVTFRLPELMRELVIRFDEGMGTRALATVD